MKKKFTNISTAKEDFSTVIKILEFHSEHKYIDVNISVINDESIEGNETFTIYLTSDVGVNVSQTEVTIIEDDKDDDKANEDDAEDDSDGGNNDNDGRDDSDDDSDVDSDGTVDSDGGDNDDYDEGNLLGLIYAWV